MSTQNPIYSNQHFRPLHVRDAFLFERGNVAGFARTGGESGTASVIGGNSNPGGSPDVPFVIGVYSAMSEAKQPGNIRCIDSEILFNYPGEAGVLIQVNPTGIDGNPTTPNTAAASIASIRGAISVGGVYTGNTNPSGQPNADPTVTTATTIAGGYLYGVSGKIIVAGTLSTPNFVAALQGQLDLSHAVALSSTNVSALWLDMGATISAALISSGVANLNIVNLTNTAPGATINSVFHVEALATYLFDISNASYSPFITTTSPGTAYGRIAINTTAGVKYIGVYNA